MSDFKETQHGRNHSKRGSDPIATFLEYDVANVGDWLLIEATSSDTLTDFYGMKFVATEGFKFVAAGLNGNFTVTIANQWFVTALDIDFTGTGSHVTDFSGQSAGNHNSATYAGDFTLAAATGITLETTSTPVQVLTHGGDVTVDPDGGAIALGQSVSDFVGFFGVTPVQQQDTPITLGDVISLLQAYGLSA